MVIRWSIHVYTKHESKKICGPSLKVWPIPSGVPPFFIHFTLWLFNIAMKNGPFIDGLPEGIPFIKIYYISVFIPIIFHKLSFGGTPISAMDSPLWYHLRHWARRRRRNRRLVRPNGWELGGQLELPLKNPIEIYLNGGYSWENHGTMGSFHCYAWSPEGCK